MPKVGTQVKARRSRAELVKSVKLVKLLVKLVNLVKLRQLPGMWVAPYLPGGSTSLFPRPRIQCLRQIERARTVRSSSPRCPRPFRASRRRPRTHARAGNWKTTEMELYLRYLLLLPHLSMSTEGVWSTYESNTRQSAHQTSASLNAISLT